MGSVMSREMNDKNIVFKVVMLYLNGYSFDKIAKKLNISRESVAEIIRNWGWYVRKASRVGEYVSHSGFPLYYYKIYLLWSLGFDYNDIAVSLLLPTSIVESIVGRMRKYVPNPRDFFKVVMHRIRGLDVEEIALSEDLPVEIVSLYVKYADQLLKLGVPSDKNPYDPVLYKDLFEVLNRIIMFEHAYRFFSGELFRWMYYAVSPLRCICYEEKT